MAVSRVKFQDILSSQLPRYVREEFPLLVEFLEEYYTSQEYQGGTLDLIQNLDQYLKVENLTHLKSETVLASDISYTDTTITAGFDGGFTDGFPESNGLIQIDNEIILYESKTRNQFINCYRGFSGVTSYTSPNTPDQLVFETSLSDKHSAGASIKNLNVLFLQEFLKKFKDQNSPGFAERELASGLNQENFLIQSKDFYAAKGTDDAFKILFKALYGKKVEILKPSEFLLRPSEAIYSVTQDYIVEKLQGNPENLINLTLFQNTTGARGTVTEVEKIFSEEGEYYKLSIDLGYQRDINVEGTIFSKFEPNPITQLLNTVGSGATILDVDSTLSFPESGELILIDENGETNSVTYSGKSSTQFYGITGIVSNILEKSIIRLNGFSFGTFRGQEIRVRITSTLKDTKIDSSNFYYEKDDVINIQTLGIDELNIRNQNWFSNVKSFYDVKEVLLVSSSENIYTVKLFDDQYLKIGNRISLLQLPNQNPVGGVIQVIESSNSVRVKMDGPIATQFRYKLRNEILKGNSSLYPELNNFTANIQNSYSKFDGKALVTSNSIPNYTIDGQPLPTDPYNKTVKFSGSYQNDTIITVSTSEHGFYTGDAVFYKRSEVLSNNFTNLIPGIYLVDRVDENRIRIAKSKADLFDGIFISVTGNVVDNEFVYASFYQKTVQPQEICRIFEDPENADEEYPTEPGFVGMFVNGVEILNYKSPNSVYYGPIQSMDVVSGGSNYDVINPPILEIEDKVGTGASGTVSVSGSFQEVSIVDPGFDYLEEPVISITGGNGTGAVLKANLTSIVHDVPFNSESSSVNITNNTIGFTTFHKFRDNEEVIYNTNGGTSVGGLSTDAAYRVGVVDAFTVKIYNKFDDSNSGINTVSLTSKGLGIHSFKSKNRKNIISNVIIVDSGSNYENNKKVINANVGINTALNQVFIKNHGYNTKDIIKYTPGNTPVVGVSSTKEYFVNKIDDDNFNIVEIGTDDRNFFIDRNLFVNFTELGDGSFNYPPIEVSVSGVIGVSTLSGQNFNAILQPKVRGSIISVDTTANGVGYGASTIIDFNRQPNINLNSGENAFLVPIINNGRIVDVIILESGRNYTAPPDILVVDSTGKFADLIAIIEDGKIVDVVINNGGIGYSAGSSITVNSPGQGAEIFANLPIWNVNLFERNFKTIKSDDGVLSQNINSDSLEYGAIYPPRRLRSSVYPVKEDDGKVVKLYNFTDLRLNSNREEIPNTVHSPILGWAYDGNPIYGPYAYVNPDGSGGIKKLKSGYRKKQTISNNRPPESQFPSGFFTNDYEFIENGDLDIHNGRFCITPEYPNGVYAYFTTIDDIIDSDFQNYFKPVFPFVIGNTYKSKPNVFNYQTTSIQSKYNIENNSWFRNTLPYNLVNVKGGYDYLLNSTNFQKQQIIVNAADIGSVDSIEVVDTGDNYKVTDKIFFDNKNTSGFGAQGIVQSITGRNISTISVTNELFGGVEFINGNNTYTGIVDQPHNLITGDTVVVSGISTDFPFISGPYIASVPAKTLLLSLGTNIASITGFITYFNISNDINLDDIRTNDIYTIEDEKIRVLEVDKKSSRLKVFRAIDGTSGSSHPSGTPLSLVPRTFSITSVGVPTSRKFNSNSEYYFDPSESLVVSTSVGSTVVFSNPGVGITQIFIEPQQIYLPNHGLRINDKITYDPNSGVSITYWNGLGAEAYTSLTNVDTLYVYPFTKDFIGISDIKVGMGSTGIVTGINSDAKLFYFGSTGIGNNHSFTTNLNNVVTANVSKNLVQVTTDSETNLKNDDIVRLDVISFATRSVVVKYNESNRRIVFDPKPFLNANINDNENTIEFDDYYFQFGDKVIFESTDLRLPNGLVDDGMYYVYPFDRTKIKLVKEKYELFESSPNFVKVKVNPLAPSFITYNLSKVNPLLQVQANEKIVFDLSDISLAFTSVDTGSGEPFDFSLYLDRKFINTFETTGENDTFQVVKNGRMGTSGANLTLNITNQVPNNLYYQFKPTSYSDLPFTFRQIVIDKDVDNYNTLSIVGSPVSGTYGISTVGVSTFTYTIPTNVLNQSLTPSNSQLSYITSSLTAKGGIAGITLPSGGSGYKILPGISTISTSEGTGAFLKPSSNSIGKIKNTRFKDIGFNYATDKTIRPTTSVPLLLQVEPLSSFESIGIVTYGKNYLVPPRLIVIDGSTGQVQSDAELLYNFDDPEVTILQNTFGLSESTPKIIPTNNSNGVGIDTLSYNPSTKTVTAFLDAVFLNDSLFPFEINDSVLVENVSIVPFESSSGYNSSDYNYSLFPIVGVQTNAGGLGAYVEYSMFNVLAPGFEPGTVDRTNTFGRIIPQSQFPTFDIKTKKNNFFVGETVTSGNSSGNVGRWNLDSEFLTLVTRSKFEKGNRLKGSVSNAEAVVESVFDFNGEVVTGVGATVFNGWKNNVGFLNDNLQRLPDNEYYQYFSYSLKSEVPLSTWEDSVDTLSHVAGFERFSDYVVETTSQKTATPSTVDVETIADIVSIESLNCYVDYDDGFERTLSINGKTISNKIIFKNRILIDYFESIGNRVLPIDNFSGEFNNAERGDKTETIATYEDIDIWNRIFIFTQNIVDTSSTQVSILDVLQYDDNAYVNEYAIGETNLPLGTYEYVADPENNSWKLNFAPIDFEFTEYASTTLAFSMRNIAGVAFTSIGNIVDIFSESDTIQPGVGQTIITGISPNIQAGKALVLLEDNEGNVEGHELSFCHNDIDVSLSVFGSISNNGSLLFNSSGFGTFGASLNGSGGVDVQFFSGVGNTITSQSSIIAVYDGATGNVGATLDLDASQLITSNVNIPSSATPTAVVIDSYAEPFLSAYYYILAQDVANNEYESFEVYSLATYEFPNPNFVVEFGNIQTGGSTLGTIELQTSEFGIELLYTPRPNSTIDLRIFTTRQRTDLGSISQPKFLMSTRTNALGQVFGTGNFSIVSQVGIFRGTRIEIPAKFPIKYEGREVFKRSFNGESSRIVNVDQNSVLIPNHYFVTGEKLFYSITELEQRIGIAATVVPGIGLTDKLPPEVYAVKVSDSILQFSPTVEESLQRFPTVFDITSVGIGTTHTLQADLQNTKALICIDNLIQSPLAGTAVTYTLTEKVERQPFISLTGITSISYNDVLSVGSEYVIVEGVGVGGPNNVKVRRGEVGTEVTNHPAGELVTKLSGNYYISNNIINFVEPPYGPRPISTTTGNPDERDWQGISQSSTFQGRVFLRTGYVNGTDETYTNNHIFDDISNQFTGLTSTFTLKEFNQDIVGFSTNNGIVLINGIPQRPAGVQRGLGSYTLNENVGFTDISFLGTASSIGYDPNRTGLPRGGLIVSVGSVQGFGFQPLVTAGGVAVLGPSGEVTSISIGNSGSGYRSGLQDPINVGIQTVSVGSSGITFIGTAAVQNGHIVSVAVTNPLSGFDEGPIKVVFDSPLEYEDIPLIYSSTSVAGIGTGATVDLQVGVASSVSSFTLVDKGFGYGEGEILTVAVGGTTGIPLNSSLPYSEFQITVEDNFTDPFNGWTFGELEPLDDITDFDGVEDAFDLRLEGVPISIQSRRGSRIDISQVLLVFLNDVLQEPNVAYIFTGGSTIVFTEPPKPGSIVNVLFYKGTPDKDVIFTEVLRTVKRGDTVELNNDPQNRQSILLDEDPRVVTKIQTLDSVLTNPYPGPGVTISRSLSRPVTWCKQTSDSIIDGEIVGKDRIELEPAIYPTAVVIQPVSIGTTIIYTNDLRPYFDPFNETADLDYQNVIDIQSQDTVDGCVVSANVNSSGEVSTIVITNNGFGYDDIPEVSIAPPVGIGSTALAEATITNGQVTGIAVTYGGSGYSTSNPPLVIVGEPRTVKETLEINDYIGDYGVITQIDDSPTPREIVFDLFIPLDSFLRDTSYANPPITLSEIQIGDYFTIFDTNVSTGGTFATQDTGGNQIGIVTNFVDGVYQVSAVTTATETIPGVGSTTIVRVNARVESGTGVIPNTSGANLGNYSWGKILLKDVVRISDLPFYGENGYTGIKTSGLVNRNKPLRFERYI